MPKLEPPANPIVEHCPRCGAQKVIGYIYPQVAWGLSHCDPCLTAKKLEDRIMRLKFLLRKKQDEGWVHLLEQAQFALRKLPTKL